MTLIPPEAHSLVSSVYNPYFSTQTNLQDSVVLIFVSWASAKDDALVKSYTDKVLESIDKQAKAKNLAYPFRFLNDAGLTQDPISTYGYGASVARMKAVSKKYDPQGFFQANVPGFKLGGEIHGY